MKKIILSFILTMVTIASFGQLRVKLSEYGIEPYYETLHFVIENEYFNPVYVFAISATDVNRNSTFYYSNDPIIINSYNGYANAWMSNYDLYITKSSVNNSSVFNSTYMIEIMYAEVYDGAQMKINKFYTNSSIGMYLREDTTSNIENVQNNKVNKYYDLNGNIINNPQKGKIYIYNNKKIIY